MTKTTNTDAGREAARRAVQPHDWMWLVDSNGSKADFYEKGFNSGYDAALTAGDLKPTLLRIVRKYPDAVKEIEAMQNVTDAVYMPAYGVTPAIFVTHDGGQDRVRLEESKPEPAGSASEHCGRNCCPICDEPAPPTPLVQGEVCETVTIAAHDNAMYERIVEILLVEMNNYPDGLDADELLKAIIADRDAKPAKVDRNAVIEAASNALLVLQTAEFFHDTYERLAPEFGYETRPDTKRFDFETPNGKLMVAVVSEVIDYLAKHGIDGEVSE